MLVQSVFGGIGDASQMWLGNFPGKSSRMPLDAEARIGMKTRFTGRDDGRFSTDVVARCGADPVQANRLRTGAKTSEKGVDARFDATLYSGHISRRPWHRAMPADPRWLGSMTCHVTTSFTRWWRFL